MEAEHRKSTKAQLVFALARGISPAKWARNNGVTKMTAYRWSKQPEVRKAVEAFRRRTLDLAIGRFTTLSTRATDGIAKLVREADSDSVRLKACRAVFSDMVTVTKFVGWESRLAVLEEKAGGGPDPGATYLGSWALASGGQGTIRPAALPVGPIGNGGG
jgi:hypothetical protein